MKFIRLIKIIVTLKRYGIFSILSKYHQTSNLARCMRIGLFFIPSKHKHEPLPTRMRMAFEELGPIFVKFGQILSTREDLIPAAYISELTKLQSAVPAFSGAIAKQIVESALITLNKDFDQTFSYFTTDAIASASVAQVHKATLKSTNQEVAVKILRPNIAKIIKQDIELLRLAAWFAEKMLSDGKRLKPQEVIDEFDKTINAELDLLQEAAHATKLKRLHQNDRTIIVPQVFLDFCTCDVMVLEWMDGTCISDLARLAQKGINLETLAHNGVTIFYTQVFDYGFFHADMHPGNILCDDFGRYIALDFGIMGYLSDNDKRYLAINILAFFNRDYKKVAEAHVESGWAPKDTSIEELENAVRTVCEPIFNKPLKDISFGHVLIRLFQVSRRFNIPVQPQLILLQKTIVSTEALGRMLNPDLDLWQTAKPILARWMKRQISWRGFLNNIKHELPYWSYTLPKLPRLLLDNITTTETTKQHNELLLKQLKRYKQQNRILLCCISAIVIAGIAYLLIR